MSFNSSFSSSLSEGPDWDLSGVFGRDAESKVLDELAQCGTKSNSTVILHGVAGSGKSSLLVSRRWEEKGWILATGKYEKHRIGEPFSALIDALNQLVDKWVINNSHASVCQLSGFRKLMEEDVELMRNILPKAYKVVSQNSCMVSSNPQGTDPEEVEDGAERRRSSSSLAMKQDMGTVDLINASFVRILQFLCIAKPVVLFIDDIHWADESSLDVLRVLSTGCSGTVDNLILAISYRDEEIDVNEDARAMIDTIKACDCEGAKDRIHDISLGDLDVDAVKHMLSSITKQAPEECLALADVIHKKTAGNPFFVTQFLLMLRQEQFVSYSFSTFKWEWGDVNQLANAAHVSDNVADIIAKSLQSLPEATHIAVSVASCLGKVVPLDVLVEFFESFDEKEEGHTCSASLHQIQKCGLENFLDSAVKRGILIKPEGQEYMWAHDKLQHIAYSLIPDEYAASIHMKLGKLLWSMSLKLPEEECLVFMAADQMNRFIEYKGDQVLGAEVASLCLEAGKISLSKSALIPAFTMLMSGVRHLCLENKWTVHYDLCLRLYSTVAELAITLGKRQQALDAATEVESNAQTYEDKFRVQCVMLRYLTSGNDRNYQLGVKKSIEILKEYGVKFPTKLLPGQLFLEYQKLRRKFPRGKLEDVLDLPKMTDKKSLRTMKLLNYLSGYIVMSQTDQNLAWYTYIRSLKLSAEKGVCEETAVALVGLGIQLAGEGQLEEADEHAEIALKIANRYPQKVGSHHPSIIGLAAAGIYSRTKAFNKSLDMWLEAHHSSLRTGNTEKAATSIMSYTFTYLTVGLPLGPLMLDLVSYKREANQFGMPTTVVACFEIFQQFIYNLQEDVAQPAVLTGKFMDEEEVLRNLSGNGLRMTSRDSFTYRLLLAIIFGYMDMAESLLQDLEPFLEGDPFVVRAGFRRTVMALAAFRLARKKGSRKHRLIGKKVLKDYEKALTLRNVNALPIYLMLDAESSPSKEKYDKAIRGSARLGLVHFEAYLCERAAEMFIEQKDNSWAEYYMAQAYVLYDDWGARGKANRLKEEFPDLLKESSLREKASSALQGRTRYSSEYSDILKEFNWGRTSSIRASNFSLKAGDDSSTDIMSDLDSSGRDFERSGRGSFVVDLS